MNDNSADVRYLASIALVKAGLYTSEFDFYYALSGRIDPEFLGRDWGMIPHLIKARDASAFEIVLSLLLNRKQRYHVHTSAVKWPLSLRSVPLVSDHEAEIFHDHLGNCSDLRVVAVLEHEARRADVVGALTRSTLMTAMRKVLSATGYGEIVSVLPKDCTLYEWFERGDDCSNAVEVASLLLKLTEALEVEGCPLTTWLSVGPASELLKMVPTWERSDNDVYWDMAKLISTKLKQHRCEEIRKMVDSIQPTALTALEDQSFDVDTRTRQRLAYDTSVKPLAIEVQPIRKCKTCGHTEPNGPWQMFGRSRPGAIRPFYPSNPRLDPCSKCGRETELLWQTLERTLITRDQLYDRID